MRNKILALGFIFLSGLFISCDEEYIPKPRGFFRIALPEKEYVAYVPEACPFQFDIPVYAKVMKDSSSTSLPCWLNVEFPSLNGTIYLTYKKVNDDLAKLYEEHRSMTMKHITKASAIDETPFHNYDNKVYGSLYIVKGAAASNIQFYLTDSVQNFIRGSLYFYSVPQPDSIAPVLDFVSEDVKHLVETFQWK
jgi:gliding motility-associated lipoprotein GldD